MTQVTAKKDIEIIGLEIGKFVSKQLLTGDKTNIEQWIRVLPQPLRDALLVDLLQMHRNLMNQMREIEELLPEDIKQRRLYKGVCAQPIDTLGLSTRITSSLKEENIFTVGALVEKSEIELLQLSNLGKTSVNEIKEALYVHRLSLGLRLDEKLKFLD